MHFVDRPRKRNMETEIGPHESVRAAVVRSVSAVEGCEPSTLGPLTDVLNPNALDTLFDSQPDGKPRTGGCLSFIYSHCRVTIDNGEYLTVQLLDNHHRFTNRSEPNFGAVATKN